MREDNQRNYSRKLLLRLSWVLCSLEGHGLVGARGQDVLNFLHNKRIVDDTHNPHLVQTLRTLKRIDLKNELNKLEPIFYCTPF